MENLNILIIEDDKELALELSEILEDYKYNVVAIARNYKDALTKYYQFNIDLVIIDIFLGDNPEGITFAETISTVPNAIKPFLFLTSSKDQQIFERAKLTNPFRYLLKPFNELELLYAIEMAIEKFYGQINVFASKTEDTVIAKEYLFIKKKNTLKKVNFNNIIYIEVDNRYCNIITEIENFIIQISLSKVYEYLTQNFFKQVHRKYIVNTDMIEEISLSKNSLLLKNNHLISFSESYRDIIKSFSILK
ncbi:LytTR family DNA-binding domain-containing protein [uncultured Tenacibaculum sp.]|uniref:LytR/AlgR family response regulator transcription factor n=1 Tax=uncultured Tenacibaculum sp. TaxID=174713 RepID=UPI00260E6D54|nr:response regulator transcription factor [uncultured Tenacibaculum sp.]